MTFLHTPLTTRRILRAGKNVSQYQLVAFDFLAYALDYTVHPRSAESCIGFCARCQVFFQGVDRLCKRPDKRTKFAEVTKGLEQMGTTRVNARCLGIAFWKITAALLGLRRSVWERLDCRRGAALRKLSDRSTVSCEKQLSFSLSCDGEKKSRSVVLYIRSATECLFM